MMCFTAVLLSVVYITLFNTLHEFFMPVVCVLYDIVKNGKFSVWCDFQCSLTARQGDRVKMLSHSSLHM